VNIINHGTWSSYVPNTTPQGLLPNTLFAKSDTTGRDWYDALYSDTPLLAAGSVAINAMKDDSGIWRIMVATKDATALFPAKQMLLEVTDYTGTDPQADFGGMQYVEASNSIIASPPRPTPVASVTPRQARLALLAAGLLDQATAAVTAAGGATLITWEYATEFLRSDPLIISIGSSLNLTSAQIDALFAQAATL
jgi:hypothetical protein